jgi:hypothetical protein
MVKLLRILQLLVCIGMITTFLADVNKVLKRQRQRY